MASKGNGSKNSAKIGGKKQRHLKRKQMRRTRAHGLKFLCMLLLSSVDLVMNTFADRCESCENILMSLGQMICQVGIFMSFFLFMFETYPFKVGIVRPLLKRFRAHMAIMIVYIGVSSFHVFNRNTLINDLENENEDFLRSELWDDDTFYTTFILQKMLAVPFYVAAINIGTTMTGPKYFDESYWVAYSKAKRGI